MLGFWLVWCWTFDREELINYIWESFWSSVINRRNLKTILILLYSSIHIIWFVWIWYGAGWKNIKTELVFNYKNDKNSSCFFPLPHTEFTNTGKAAWNWYQFNYIPQWALKEKRNTCMRFIDSSGNTVLWNRNNKLSGNVHIN